MMAALLLTLSGSLQAADNPILSVALNADGGTCASSRF